MKAAEFECEADLDHSLPISEIKADDQSIAMHYLTAQKCDKNSKSLSAEKHNGNGGNLVEVIEAKEMKGLVIGLDSCPKYTTIPVSSIKFTDKGSAIYIDKNGTEHNLPEIIFCLKEGSYHFVKNICLDGEMHAADRMSVDNNNMDQKAVDFDAEGDLVRDAADVTQSISDGVKVLTDCDCGIDVDIKGNSDIEIEKEQESCDCGMDVVIKGNSDNKIEKEDESFHSSSNIEDGTVDKEIVSHEFISIQDLITESSSSNFSIMIGGELQKHPDQDSCEKMDTENPELIYAAIESNEVSSESKMESTSIFTESDLIVKNEKEENLQSPNSQQFVQTLNSRIVVDGTLDDRKTWSGRYSTSKNFHGESSFSEAGHLSSLGAHLTIPYSGSISFRSDSSATSTRSFAFPILNTEWNSSPIKMIKADRRGYRKSRGWLRSFLCFKI